MEKAEKLTEFYDEAHPFKEGINQLRILVLEAGLTETYKWNFPTYTLDTKNIVAICKFKTYFGFWFFNGVFMRDPQGLLENAQEGKTKAMRHWKFTSEEQLHPAVVSSYILEAITNQKKGLHHKITRKNKNPVLIPLHLAKAFKEYDGLQAAFQALSGSKQREYVEYIEMAKQEKTKRTRLEKIVPMIIDGKSLNDLYRK